MKPALILLLATMPLCAREAKPVFEPNRGQFSEGAEYAARLDGVSAFISAGGMDFRSRTSRLRVLNAGRSAHGCEPDSSITSEVNYLDRTPAIKQVPQYSRILCRDVYPGVDWAIRTAGNKIEHDWLLAAHARLDNVLMEVDAGVSVQVENDGTLVLDSGELKTTWNKPVAWQDIDGRHRNVEVFYKVKGRRISLVAATYRHDLPLVIDPIIDFTYSTQPYQSIEQVGVDALGNVYIAGSANSLQTTQGAALAWAGSPNGLFVQKLSPAGSLVYSTYLGPYSDTVRMRVDASGNVYLAAVIRNQPLPVAGTSIDPAGNVALYKLSPAGDSLVYTARLVSQDVIGGLALAIDQSGDVYVAAATSPINPTVNNSSPYVIL